LAQGAGRSVSRFFISADADRDLDSILEDLQQFPYSFGDRLLASLEAAFFSIGLQPYLGTRHSEYSRLLGEEVRSRLVYPYRVFYRMGGSSPEIIGVIDPTRDIGPIMARRLQ
jgi:plasmid stabilization system protein ParE